MDNKNGAGPGALEKFFAGKGFYIALCLCAAVIGVSAWSLLGGGEAVQEETVDVYRPETAAPAHTLEPGFTPMPEKDAAAVAPESVSETPKVQTPPPATPSPPPTSAVSAAEETAGTAPAEWLRPVSGAVERPYSTDELMYDKTMGDWRTHAGVDLAAPLGSYVSASAAGTVTDISDDPLYGTTVTIAHGGGYESVYANLAGTPTVEIGDTVAAGETIGAVGDTAICESAEASHLHFAVYADGESVDPAGLMG